MRLPRTDIPVRVEAPGAVARQLPDFGVPEGPMGVEYFTLAAGTDLAPLLEGLEDDLCQAEHWGYVAAGRVLATYADGSADTCSTGDVFYWPAGHSVRVEEDAELIMFSPQAEHGRVMDHIAGRLAAMA
jgi:hypothetical protein